MSWGLLQAQVTNPTVKPVPTDTPQQGMPIFRVTVVERTAKAINYRHRSGATKIDFRGTHLMPGARGEAKVESKQGYIEIEVEFDDLRPATQFGAEYLTYVMWAITPEGRATNLGEIILNGTKSKLNVTTELQAFGLLVTAEPYFAVMQPSDVVVIENVVRPDTRGKVEVIDAKYELLQRGEYRMDRRLGTAPAVRLIGQEPLDLFEARNALRIARDFGADKYAADSFKKAEVLLRQAEDYHHRKQYKPTSMTAREAVQTAEDARAIAIKRQEEEKLAQERQAAADRESRAKAEAAEAEARQKAEAERRRLAEEQRLTAERQRQAAEQERLAAQKARQEAEVAARRAAEERAAADAAKAAALAEQQRLATEAERSRQAAQEADRLRQAAEQDRERLRKQLLEQFNLILETRDTARGLIVNMSDVLFDFGKWTLKPGAREKLARLSGIVLAHPGLRLEVEGHTDNVGSDSFNQELSEKRAGAVREYLVSQGLNPGALTAKGFGEGMPVASNNNAAGRQQNRRVEIVVSGEIIGTRIGPPTP
jgi:outer membrane protein OmpA-like peptidoglycan-associated protein